MRATCKICKKLLKAGYVEVGYCEDHLDMLDETYNNAATDVGFYVEDFIQEAYTEQYGNDNY